MRLFLPLLLVAVGSFACADDGDKQLEDLIARFRAADVYNQFEIGEQIADAGDPRVLPILEPWLKHRDRRIRGNVAFIFAKFGESRGLATIIEVLADQSADRRVEWEGGSLLISADESLEQAMERYSRSPGGLRAQITTDRYYAVHLLGKLRDPQAVDVLVPLLADHGISYNVAWALGKSKTSVR